jgi:hypothetical protein
MICGVDLELTPPQPPAVEQALAAILAPAQPKQDPDPWWEAGLQDTLET